MIINYPTDCHLIAINLKLYAMEENDYQVYLNLTSDAAESKYEAGTKLQDWLIDYITSHKSLLIIEDLTEL